MATRNFKSNVEYEDDKYKVLSLSDGKSHLRRITCETDGICIIPFDTSGEKIRNVYLARYLDYLSNEQGHTCITTDLTGNFDTNFEELHDMINRELGIDIDVNDLYLLGNVNHTIPFSKRYKCYGLNLDNYAKDLNGFEIDLPDNEDKLYSLDKIKLTRILNGDIEDSLAMSATLLLTSYMK